MNSAGADPEAALRHDLPGAVDHDRHDWRTGGDRQHERAFLERSQRVALAACALGTHDDVESITDLARHRLVGLQGRLSILAREEHDARTFRAPAEDGNVAQLGLGDEGVPRQHRRDGEDVVPAHVIARVHGARSAREMFPPVHDDPNAGDAA